MKIPRVLSLRVALSLLFVVTPLVALVIVGSITLAIRLPQVAEENRTIAKESAAEMAARVEQYLRSLEHRLKVLAAAVDNVPEQEVYFLLQTARGDGFDAIYLVDEQGILVDASVKNYSTEYIEEIVGIDMSGNRLFRTVTETHKQAWSDTQLSSISGIVTVGVAVPLAGSNKTIIGEVPLDQIVSISQFSRSDRQLDLWIVDRLGEVVADTRIARSGRLNLLHLPIVQAGLSGDPMPEVLSYDGRDYFAWAEFSESLGWLFVSRIPRGMDNSTTRELITIIVTGFISTSIIGALLAPLWAQTMSRTVKSVIERARLVASGRQPEAWPTGTIKEFNQLSGDLEAMAEALVSREQALKQMNEELEDRVKKRTHDLASSNADLSEALHNLQMTQNELIEVEKLAALGRLVAGIAHELNTPLGNSKLSLSAQSHEIENFGQLLAKGLRKSDLMVFLDRIRETTSMASMNVERACDLVTNFKQVAVDRTTSYRRVFRLHELVSGTVLTLQPSIEKNIQVIVEDIPEELEIDSYPGELGQILTNLLDNASKHAFPDRSGSIHIAVTEARKGAIRICVRDDGIGMPPDVLEKIFNPFYTTKFGQGGTGLGLHISYNAAANVLGGSLTVESTPGEGTAFTLLIPVIAPEPEDPGSRSEDTPTVRA
ncbi:ATP-binding protein [uncultured Nisaea sp.]|uniref:sensor histidine kinase n=1 Tax=uncultured Nisaea sp. TaxID=538215 RepID=UPI0030ECBD60|tara:strand:- start:4211 stop:6184 length:1974 start_codon:yes stop_codon:yes gene_type:complete